MVDSGKSGGLNNEGMQILVTNRAVEFGQKVYTDVLFPRMLKEMGVDDWKTDTLSERGGRRDNQTQKRRDGSQPSTTNDDVRIQTRTARRGRRDIRFVYKKIDPMEGQGMPPGMPPGGPPMGGMGMPPGQMPPMPPQGGPIGATGLNQQMPPNMMRQVMPPSQPGGEGVGMRTPRGPAAPQRRTTGGSGSPISSVQQRGAQPSQQEQNSRALMNARRFRGA